jgi:DNA-3-methyladenine glycosylase I
MKKRCSWVSESQLYIDYHDKEWGEPVFDDEKIGRAHV